MKNLSSLKISEIEDLSRQNNDPGWLKKLRLNAFTKFMELEQPKFKYGLSTNLNCEFSFENIDINKINSEKINDSNELKILSPSEVDEKISSLITDVISKTNLNKFDAFAISFSNPQILVIPKNYKSDKTIQLESELKNDNAEFLIIYCDEESEATIIDKISSGNYLNSKFILIICKNNSKINYASIQNLSQSTFNFTTRIGEAENNSVINWLDFCIGSLFTNSSTFTTLNGEGSITNNYGMFFGSQNQQFNIIASALHNAPHTICDMLTRGVLNSKSKAIYHGTIRVESNAFGSNGYQKEDTLLLSEQAQADSIPKLEIENHDVRCTHGATIGQVDSEKLFYLMSRGLSKEKATELLVHAFLTPILDKLQIQNLKEDLEKEIEIKIKSK